MKIKGQVLCLPVLFAGLVFCLLLTSCGLFYYDDSRSVAETITPSGIISSSNNDIYVTEVIDGDTFSIYTGDTVRMLGINTPEIDRYYYSAAKNILDIMIGGKQVELQKDITDRDSYGRLLRYVYMGDIFVNLEMVRKGYANVYTLPPDIRYSEELLRAERHARENGLGLWAETRQQYDIRLLLNYDAEGDDRKNLNGEYLILRNEGSTDLNIKGWTVKDSGTSIYEFGRFIFSEGTEIILFTGSGNDKKGMFYWSSTNPVWNNGHDAVYLRDREGLLIEYFDY